MSLLQNNDLVRPSEASSSLVVVVAVAVAVAVVVVVVVVVEEKICGCALSRELRYGVFCAGSLLLVDGLELVI